MTKFALFFNINDISNRNKNIFALVLLCIPQFKKIYIFFRIFLSTNKLNTVDNFRLKHWRQLTPFFSFFVDDLTQNFLLIPNLTIFQWLLLYYKKTSILYLKRYRSLKFGQNGFWPISLAKLDQFFFCLDTSR